MHQGDQVRFHPRGVIQTAGRGILDPNMYIDCDGCVVAGDAKHLKIGEGPVQLSTRQPAGARQVIRRNPGIDRRIHDVAHKVHQLHAPNPGDLRAFQNRSRLINRPDAQRGREHLHPVSSRLSSVASSSQATAVFTRVSSVVLSRSNS